MLSKVAERVYWTARYLERIENTARQVGVYTYLLLDVPRNVNLGWYSLVELNSLQPQFDERYKNRDERNVVKFILADDTNPASVVSSLKWVRENVRTTRDVVPVETWELINQLSIYLNDNLHLIASRGQRGTVLKQIIAGCQRINGLLYGTMPHDQAWDFMRLGRNLERADQTTRILDAGVAAIMATEDADGVINARQIIWGHILRSLGADQSYRRKLRAAVQGGAVVRYLLEDEQFPRAIAHCLNAFEQSAGRLPRSEPVVRFVREQRENLLTDFYFEEAASPQTRDLLNDLQVALGGVHGAIASNWFNQI